MADARRKLASINSTRAAGRTAYALRKVSRAAVGGQELLLGISNDITIANIASKLDWDTCNVLQMVSREWRQAIYNRSVYDSRVFSKSTKAFLVVVSYEDPFARLPKLVLTLYSCTDNYSIRLPPIPPTPQVRAHSDSVHCLCLEGRVYIWIRQRRAERMQFYVLDLAGDRRWAKRKMVNYPRCKHAFGVLDGKIYRCQAQLCGVTTLDDSFQRQLSSEEKVQELPHVEIYDPIHDAWSLITPTTPVSAVVSSVDLEHYSASFSDWEQGKLALEPSETILPNGPYESYLSEWKLKQEHECATISTVDNDFSNDMANQIYYTHSPFSLISVADERVFFFEGKLVKYVDHGFNTDSELEIDIEKYDPQTSTWEDWKLVSTTFESLEEGYAYSINEFDGFAAANSSIWAIVGVYSRNLDPVVVTYFLVRSPKLVEDDNVNSVMWIDTGFQVGNNRPSNQRNALRPIYL